MTSRTFQWTPLAQARRIAAMDARLTGIDMAFGLVYVLAGFFIFTDARNAVHIVVAPFVVLSCVLFYLAVRICGPEGDDATAMFFASLPRSRHITFWTHALWLAALALALEAVIGIGIALRLNAGLPGQQFAVTSFFMILPFFAIACGLFKTYYHHYPTLRIFADILVVVAYVIIFIFLVVPAEFSQKDGIVKSRHITNREYFRLGLVLATLTIFLLGYVYQRWMKIQVGENS